VPATWASTTGRWGERRGSCSPTGRMCSEMLVITPAGHRHDTPTPYGRRYAKSCFESIITAALLAAYGVRSYEYTMMPLVDAVLTTCPRPCCISVGRNTWLLRTMPRRFTSRRRLH